MKTEGSLRCLQKFINASFILFFYNSVALMFNYCKNRSIVIICSCASLNNQPIRVSNMNHRSEQVVYNYTVLQLSLFGGKEKVAF
jgi:hypothetical protein